MARRTKNSQHVYLHIHELQLYCVLCYLQYGSNLPLGCEWLLFLSTVVIVDMLLAVSILFHWFMFWFALKLKYSHDACSVLSSEPVPRRATSTQKVIHGEHMQLINGGGIPIFTRGSPLLMLKMGTGRGPYLHIHSVPKINFYDTGSEIPLPTRAHACMLGPSCTNVHA